MPTENDIDWLKGMVQLEDEAGGFPSVTGGVRQRVWRNVERPGYFGRRRDLRHAQFDAQHGAGNWRLAWIVPAFKDNPEVVLSFVQACKVIYEESYFQHLQNRPVDVDFICEFTECIDNAPTNVHSGLDYTAQEAYSTHIQDIAVRNVLAKLGRAFTGKRTELLVIRSVDSNGHQFGPGNVPLYRPGIITRPSLCPAWASRDSVEDFWQSNKWLQVAA